MLMMRALAVVGVGLSVTTAAFAADSSSPSSSFSAAEGASRARRMQARAGRVIGHGVSFVPQEEGAGAARGLRADVDGEEEDMSPFLPTSSSLPAAARARSLSYSGKDAQGGHVNFQGTASVRERVVSLDRLAGVAGVDCDGTSVVVALDTSSSPSPSLPAWAAEGVVLVGGAHFACAHTDDGLAMPFYVQVTGAPSAVPLASFAASTSPVLLVHLPTTPVPATAAFSRLSLTVDREAPRPAAAAAAAAASAAEESSSSSSSAPNRPRSLAAATAWSSNVWSEFADSASPESLRANNDAGWHQFAGNSWNLGPGNGGSNPAVAGAVLSPLISLPNTGGLLALCTGCSAWVYADFSISLTSDGAAVEAVTADATVYTSATFVLDGVFPSTGHNMTALAPLTRTVNESTFDPDTNTTSYNASTVEIPNPVPDTLFGYSLLPERTVAVLAFDVLGVPFAIPVRVRLDLGFNVRFNATAGGPLTNPNATAAVTGVGFSLNGATTLGATFDRARGWTSDRSRVFSVQPATPRFDLPATLGLDIVPVYTVTASIFGGITMTATIRAQQRVLARAGAVDNVCSGNNTRVYSDIRSNVLGTVAITAPTAPINFAPQCAVYGCTPGAVSAPLVPVSGAVGSLSTLPRTLGPLALLPESSLAGGPGVGCTGNKLAVFSEAAILAIAKGERYWYAGGSLSALYNSTLVCAAPFACSYEATAFDPCTADCGVKSTRSRTISCRANINGTSVLVPTEACLASPTAGQVPPTTVDCQVPNCGQVRAYGGGNTICNDTLAAMTNSAFNIPARPGCTPVIAAGKYFKNLQCGGTGMTGAICDDPYCSVCTPITIGQLSQCVPNAIAGSITVFATCDQGTTQNSYDEFTILESGRGAAIAMSTPTANPTWRYFAIPYSPTSDVNTITVTITYTPNSQKGSSLDATLFTVLSTTTPKCTDPTTCGYPFVDRSDELIGSVTTEVFPGIFVTDTVRMRTLSVKVGSLVPPPNVFGARGQPRIYLATLCASSLQSGGACVFNAYASYKNTPAQPISSTVTLQQPGEPFYFLYRPAADAIGFAALAISVSADGDGFVATKVASTTSPQGMAWPTASDVGKPSVYANTFTPGLSKAVTPAGFRNLINGSAVVATVTTPHGGFGGAAGPADFLVTLQAGSKQNDAPNTWVAWLFDFYRLNAGDVYVHEVPANSRLGYVVSVPPSANAVLVTLTVTRGAATVCLGPGFAALDPRTCASSATGTANSPARATVVAYAASTWWGPALTATVYGDGDVDYSIRALPVASLESTAHAHGWVGPGQMAAFLGPSAETTSAQNSRFSTQTLDVSRLPGLSYALRVASGSSSEPGAFTVVASATTPEDRLAGRVGIPTTPLPGEEALTVAPGGSASVERTYAVPSRGQPVAIGLKGEAHSTPVTSIPLFHNGVQANSGDSYNQRSLQAASAAAGMGMGLEPTLPGVAMGDQGGWTDQRNADPRLYAWDGVTLSWVEFPLTAAACPLGSNAAAFAAAASTAYEYPITTAVCGLLPISLFAATSSVPAPAAAAPPAASGDGPAPSASPAPPAAFVLPRNPNAALMLRLPGGIRARLVATPAFGPSNATVNAVPGGFVPTFYVCPEGAGGLEEDKAQCSLAQTQTIAVDLANCGAGPRGARLAVRPLVPIPASAVPADGQDAWMAVTVLQSSARGSATVCPGSGANDANVYSWSVGAWSGCTSACGKGLQSRSVKCVMSATGDAVADSTLCPGPIPPAQKVCDNGVCQMTPGPWSVCNVPCGGGVQSRTLRCVNMGGNGTEVDPSLCMGRSPTSVGGDVLSTPAAPSTQACNPQACIASTPSNPSYYYIISDWSACTATCDGGVQTRTVTCAQYGTGPGGLLFYPATDSLCDAGRAVNSPPGISVYVRPPTMRTCNTRACASSAYDLTFAEIRRLPYSVGGYFNASDSTPDFQDPITDVLIPNQGVRVFEVPNPSRVAVPKFPAIPAGTNLTAYFLANPIPPTYPDTHHGVCIDVRVRAVTGTCSEADTRAVGECLAALSGCLSSVPQNGTSPFSSTTPLPLNLPVTRNPIADPAATCGCYAAAQGCVAQYKCTPSRPVSGLGVLLAPTSVLSGEDTADVPSSLYASCWTSACSLLAATQFSAVNASCSAVASTEGNAIYASGVPVVLDVFAVPRGPAGASGQAPAPLAALQFGRPVVTASTIAVGRGAPDARRTAIALDTRSIPSSAASVLIGVRASGPGVNLTITTNFTTTPPVLAAGSLAFGNYYNQSLPLVTYDRRDGYTGWEMTFGTGRFATIGTGYLAAEQVAAGGLSLVLTLACDAFTDPNAPGALAARSAQFAVPESSAIVPLTAFFGGFRATSVVNPTANGGLGNPVQNGWNAVALPYLLSPEVAAMINSSYVHVSPDNTTLVLTLPPIPGYAPASDEVLTYTIPGAFLVSGRDTPVINKVNVNASLTATRDCVVSAWSPWTSCFTGLVGCSAGTQTRARKVLVQPRGPGAVACPALLTDSRPCDACDPCQAVTCFNQGMCVEGKCVCPPGFGGPDCSAPPAFTRTCTLSAGSWGTCGPYDPFKGRGVGGTSFRSVSCDCQNVTSPESAANPSPSAAPTPSSSQTPSTTPAPPSASSTVSLTPTPSFTPSSSPWQCDNSTGISNCTSPSPTASPSVSETPSQSPTISSSPSITATPSTTPSLTPSISVSPSPTPSFNWTGNFSAAPNASTSPSPTPSVTPVYAPLGCSYVSALPYSTACPVHPAGGAWRNVTAIHVTIPLPGVNTRALAQHGNIWDAYSEAFVRQLVLAMAVPKHVLRPLVVSAQCEPLVPGQALPPQLANVGCIRLEIVEDPELVAAPTGSLTAVQTLYRLAAAVGATTDAFRVGGDGMVPNAVYNEARNAETSLLLKPFAALGAIGSVALVTFEVVSAVDPLAPPFLFPAALPWHPTPSTGVLTQVIGIRALATPGTPSNAVTQTAAESGVLQTTTIAFAVLFVLAAAAVGLIIRKRGLSSRAPRRGSNMKRRGSTKFELARVETTNPLSSAPVVVETTGGSSGSSGSGGRGVGFSSIFAAPPPIAAGGRGASAAAAHRHVFNPLQKQPGGATV
jgi:hypothetical protein